MPLTEIQKIILKRTATQTAILQVVRLFTCCPIQFAIAKISIFFIPQKNASPQLSLKDQTDLETDGFHVKIELNQPGYIRAVVTSNANATKIEWAQDSSWRFMPIQESNEAGFILHPVDLSINKLLALAGRNEVRDFLDVMHTHENVLPLGAQVWAACGKDPGFNPVSLMELLRRRGKNRPEDFKRLHLTQEVDVVQLKTK